MPLPRCVGRPRLVVPDDGPAVAVMTERVRFRLFEGAVWWTGNWGDRGWGVRDSSLELVGSSDADEKCMGEVGGSTGLGRLVG